MQFKLTDDQQRIADGLKQILKGVVTDESLKALSKEGVWFHQRAWQALAEAEMLGLGLPEAHGGAGFGMLELCLLLEQVGRTVAPIPALETLVSAGLPIAQFGTERVLAHALVQAGDVAGSLQPAAIVDAQAIGINHLCGLGLLECADVGGHGMADTFQQGAENIRPAVGELEPEQQGFGLGIMDRCA